MKKRIKSNEDKTGWYRVKNPNVDRSRLYFKGDLLGEVVDVPGGYCAYKYGKDYPLTEVLDTKKEAKQVLEETVNF